MTLHFINGESKEKFLKKYNPLYKFTNINRFFESIDKTEFGFVNPVLWNDPFEKFYLENDFYIGGKKFSLPIKDRVFATCMSKKISSEAYWKVYAPKEDGIRVKINSEKLINILENLPEVKIYIGKVDYKTTQDFSDGLFDSDNLINEILSGKIGDEQIKLLFKKRVSFDYEEEIRILIVPETKPDNSMVYNLNNKIIEFSTGYLLDPRLGEYNANVLTDHFKLTFKIRVSQSKLYNLTREPIVLLRTRKKTKEMNENFVIEEIKNVVTNAHSFSNGLVGESSISKKYLYDQLLDKHKELNGTLIHLALLELQDKGFIDFNNDSDIIYILNFN